MQSNNFIEQAQKVLSKLSSVISLLDERGVALVPDFRTEQVTPPQRLEPGRPHVIDGKTWINVKLPPIAYIVVHGSEAASVDCAILAHSLLLSISSHTPISDKTAAVRAILRDEVRSPALETAALDNGLKVEVDQTVMVFFVKNPGKHSAYELLSELIPVSGDDTLVEMNTHTVALIKPLTPEETIEDLIQFGEAVEQNLLTETAIRVSVAIGEIKPSLHQIAAAYVEAWAALETGTSFRPETNVYAYERLALERFIQDTPHEVALKYHQLLFNRKNARLFSDELLHTIDMFFAKDLNLSDTARQLYIHRNTLVYRLDKVQRQTGLDIRKFDDAIIYRILFLLGRVGKDSQVKAQ